MKMLTRSQVAERLQISPHRAGELMEEMRYTMVGKRKRVSEDALNEYIIRNTRPAQMPKQPKRKARHTDLNIFNEDGTLRKRRLGKEPA